VQVLQAGEHKLILLELDPEFLTNIAKQATFECQIEDGARTVVLELAAASREEPLLLFDASDSGNLGWFSRCQFYVDGRTGAILQTPMQMANRKDRGGRLMSTGVRIQISKELPAAFRLPGKQPVTEQMVYAVFFNFLNALLNGGVGVCGGPVVKPLAGRSEGIGTRN
jgi:hypothetical protein